MFIFKSMHIQFNNTYISHQSKIMVLVYWGTQYIFIETSEIWMVLVDCGTHYELSWSWLSSGEISNCGRILVVELVERYEISNFGHILVREHEKQILFRCTTNILVIIGDWSYIGLDTCLVKVRSTWSNWKCKLESRTSQLKLDTWKCVKRSVTLHIICDIYLYRD